ncbi:hypothetical protein N7450_001927 [Penicillium hetheringtonii]|uniref:NB-ARC domain-containing protein n=1 Tax=Penicillium hetheringtonii TaxID=911720 RepID=A0AAD6E4Z4_9EURO|nr:hypothetical protein N7450_001927 [Penicillium hetheringtonii]
MFVGREDMIRVIQEKHGAVGQRHERVALVGLAGVGKTQMALEYSYRVRDTAPNLWVFWIHASNVARLEQGYQQIAAVAEIPGRDDPKTNIFLLVSDWLCDAHNGRWLMILDNVDDDDIFFSGDESDERGPLAKFLPQAMHGSILITSRNSLAAANLAGGKSNILEIHPMSEEESIDLLRTRIPVSQQADTGEDEKTLVRALEYIPLAISQAGSYIAHRSSRITVSRYLQLFYQSESNQAHLLQYEDAKDLRRDTSIRHAVITTWQISFERINREWPAAIDILALLGMFDRQGIPETLVRVDGDELLFEDAVAPLISHSLIRFELETASFDMHRIVQLSVRTWLKIHSKLGHWQKKSRAIMAQIFPDGQYESWTECKRLLPHAKEVVKSKSSDSKEDRLYTATISFNCGWFLMLRGEYREAHTSQEYALKTREELLGFEHPETLTSASNFANVFHRQGQYKKAEEIHRRILKARETVLGREHPRTLTTVSYLGLIFSDQGKYKEAEGMHRWTLEIREKSFGSNHPHTITSINDLGNILSKQGKHDEAETMHRWVLGKREELLGYKHIDTLTTVNDLGIVLFRQRKYEEAELMHQRAIQARTEVIGSQHPHTLNSINDLGNVLSKQGKYQQAEANYRQALKAREEVIGREHPHTLITVEDLGVLLFKRGENDDAKAMHRRAMETRLKVLGCEHPHTLASIDSLVTILASEGKYQEANAIHRMVLR